MANQTVPIFYAIDKNYIPYLSVSILSLKEKISKDRQYKIYILHTDISDDESEVVKELSGENLEINFIDVSEILSVISARLPLRDYYTFTIYFRLFIAELFPQYDKAVYIDTDTVLTADIAELFDHDLGSNIVGAAVCSVVDSVEEFTKYAKECLGLEKGYYFNSGVLLMNLKLFRELDFVNKFFDVANRYKFLVAPDQDYLNVMCRNRVLYLSEEWNAESKYCPKEGSGFMPKIIHYSLTSKPWHYDGLNWGDLFWNVAKRTKFYDYILNVKKTYPIEKKLKDDGVESGLMALSKSERSKPITYYQQYGTSDAIIG